jgi:hypothetical protein
MTKHQLVRNRAAVRKRKADRANRKEALILALQMGGSVAGFGGSLVDTAKRIAKYLSSGA